MKNKKRIFIISIVVITIIVLLIYAFSTLQNYIIIPELE